MRIAGLFAVAVSLITAPAIAAYPDRPITIIVPFSAGGNADLGVRTAQPYLEACLDGSIVVVNRPGAGGGVGFAELAVAPADGYTVGLINTPNFYSYPIVRETPWQGRQLRFPRAASWARLSRSMCARTAPSSRSRS